MDLHKHVDSSDFNTEWTQMNYQNFADWLVGYQNPNNYWKSHPTYIICEVNFLVAAAIQLVHAFKTGGRWPWLILAAIGQGFVVEFLSYFAPFIDNFWHGQTLITLFDRRMPLYIAVLYPVFYYHASWACSKMKLKSQMAEHLAIGLMTVLIDMPYDIVGPKFVHWIWHDTDPNIYDRHYWVPWNSYYFHLCFSASFQFWFHSVQKWVEKRKLAKWEAGSLKSEIIASLAAAFLGMPGGCLLFMALYHPLHDFYNVSSEVTAVCVLMIATAIVWKFDRKSERYDKPTKMNLISKILFAHIMIHYLAFLGSVLIFNPEEVISVGIHQRVGNCNETEPVHTVLKTLQRKKYLCLDDYDEAYYDFHCLPNGKVPKEGSIWYTVCGTPFENRAEYVTVLSLITFIAYTVFISLFYDYDENVERLWKKVKFSKKDN